MGGCGEERRGKGGGEEEREEREGGERGGGRREVVVVVQTIQSTPRRPGSCQRAANWVAEHLGASSRRPRHPFSALMAGVNPVRVPVYTALKKLTIAMMSSTTHDVANTGTSTSLSKKKDPGT